MLLLAHSRSSSHFLQTGYQKKCYLSVWIVLLIWIHSRILGSPDCINPDYFFSAESASSSFPDHSNRSNQKGNGCYQKERTERAATAKEICLASKIHAAKKEAGGTYLANGNNDCHHKKIYIKIKFNLKSLQKSTFIFIFV